MLKTFWGLTLFLLLSTTLNAQPKELLDIGENKMFVTSEFFDKRLEIPYDICTEENNDYNYTSFKTLERLVINMSDGEVYYLKHVEDTSETKVVLCAKIDVVKTLALMKVLGFIP